MGIGTPTSDKVLFIGLHSVYLLGVLWHSGKLFLSAKGKGAFFIASMNKVWYTHLDKLGFAGARNETENGLRKRSVEGEERNAY